MPMRDVTCPGNALNTCSRLAAAGAKGADSTWPKRTKDMPTTGHNVEESSEMTGVHAGWGRWVSREEWGKR